MKEDKRYVENIEVTFTTSTEGLDSSAGGGSYTRAVSSGNIYEDEM